MDWLALTTVIVSALVAFGTSLFTTRWRFKHELELDRATRERDRDERIRASLDAAAGPLVVSVRDLLARLANILDRQGHPVLSADFDTRKEDSWSVTHDYFMSSSAYVFAAYFARADILRQRLGPDGEAASTQPLVLAVYEAEKALSEWPNAFTGVCTGVDTQVFAWQQRALGQVLVSDRPSGEVMTYGQFLLVKESFDIHVEPVRMLLLDMSGEEQDCRRRRLHQFREALLPVETECSRLLLRPTSR